MNKDNKMGTTKRTPKTKYHLFAGTVYYATGGVNDYKKSSKNLSELIEEAKKFELDESDPWWHICDDSFNIVEKSENTPYGK